ncbi:MAG: tetratricopeptide repeat protein [candidate division WOR-3 bacterium]
METSEASPEELTTHFFYYWQNHDYLAMYNRLSPTFVEKVPYERFQCILEAVSLQHPIKWFVVRSSHGVYADAAQTTSLFRETYAVRVDLDRRALEALWEIKDYIEHIKDLRSPSKKRITQNMGESVAYPLGQVQIVCRLTKVQGKWKIANFPFLNLWSQEEIDADAVIRSYHKAATDKLYAALHEEHSGNDLTAFRLYQRVSKQYPQSESAPGAEWSMGALLYRQERYNEALIQFKKTEGRYPESRWIPDLLFYQGMSYAALGRYEDAIKAYQGALRRHPDQAVDRRRVVQEHLSDARQIQRMKILFLGGLLYYLLR